MGLLKCDHNKGLITLTLITLYYVLNILEGVFVRYESFFSMNIGIKSFHLLPVFVRIYSI
jgi:hypothetical protein